MQVEGSELLLGYLCEPWRYFAWVYNFFKKKILFWTIPGKVRGPVLSMCSEAFPCCLGPDVGPAVELGSVICKALNLLPVLAVCQLRFPSRGQSCITVGRSLVLHKANLGSRPSTPEFLEPSWADEGVTLSKQFVTWKPFLPKKMFVLMKNCRIVQKKITQFLPF